MYLRQRAGHRLIPDGNGIGAMGHQAARTAAGRIFGSGGNKYQLGLLPGEHLVPHHKMEESVHHYKTLNNLHHHGLHPSLLPPGLHAAHIIQRTLHESDNHSPRGGVLPAFLPLAVGAAMPFISEAVKGLIGGFGKRSGEHLAGKLHGAGVPMPIHDHRGMRHYKIHGEGFKELLKGAMSHLHRIITSQPARKLGHHAVEALKEAFLNSIIENIDKMAKGITNKIGFGKETAKSNPGASAELQPDAPESDDEFHDALAPLEGSGGGEHNLHGLVGRGKKRRRKAAPTTRKSASKKRRVHHRPPLNRILDPVY
jgi:hypothetical protein